MIRAIIFDLDGTLVQTERLKAISYARAAVDLCPHDLRESDVIDAFKEVVGLSRREVAETLVTRFHLEEKARAHLAEFGVSTPWQAFVQVRLRHYQALLADPDALRANQWPHNVALLEMARRAGCKTALATMSHCPQVQRVLDILGWQGKFDFIATRDDVERGKPDPEIYRLVSSELDIPPPACLVIGSGKALAEKASEIVIQFRRPPHLMFPLPPDARITRNQIALCVQPDEGMHFRYEVKVPDTETDMKTVEADFHYRDAFGPSAIPDAYERLLLDALEGDASLFTRSDGIEAAWRFVDPIIRHWEESDIPLVTYEPGSWGPGEADALLARQNHAWSRGCVH